MNVLAPNIPGYEIIERAGEGGMSVVWKARDIRTGRIVALKILNSDLLSSPEDLSAFIDEERAMEQIDHPGIVKGFELACQSGRWFYVMEYVDGYNFQSLLQRKRHIAEPDCLLICESVAAALDTAWNDYGIVHRDIKPENIMINREGVIKLTDLGLCHEFRNLKADSIVVPDHVMGTPAYISPEQIYGDTEPDCRADIYSLAATLYHLSTGRTLFQNLSNDETLRAHCSETSFAKDPRAYYPELSEGFCRLLEAMLVKNRDSRMQSWLEVYNMCHDIETGIKFKPRKSSGASSVRLVNF